MMLWYMHDCLLPAQVVGIDASSEDMFGSNPDNAIDAGPEMLNGVDDVDDYGNTVDEIEPEYA